MGGVGGGRRGVAEREREGHDLSCKPVEVCYFFVNICCSSSFQDTSFVKF